MFAGGGEVQSARAPGRFVGGDDELDEPGAAIVDDVVAVLVVVVPARWPDEGEAEQPGVTSPGMSPKTRIFRP